MGALYWAFSRFTVQPGSSSKHYFLFIGSPLCLQQLIDKGKAVLLISASIPDGCGAWAVPTSECRDRSHVILSLPILSIYEHREPLGRTSSRHVPALTTRQSPSPCRPWRSPTGTAVSCWKPPVDGTPREPVANLPLTSAGTRGGCQGNISFMLALS